MTSTFAGHASPQLPDAVAEIVAELRLEASVEQIWLIGSQASGRATASSDWDLLVFSSEDPRECPCRRIGVDVLWRGPSGRILLEGKPSCFAFYFSDLQWSESAPGYATYRGSKFQGDDLEVRDSPAMIFLQSSALRLWTRQVSTSTLSVT
jgi:Nucleotidyltransferase domain